MIRSQTVFVVGAGASFELGFPLGEGLLENIGRALDFEEDAFGNGLEGDRRIWRDLHWTAQQRGHRARPYLEAAWRVRDAAHLGLSIDNVIHQQNDDELFVLCAKLAIASQILDAESSSDLRIHDNSRSLTWPNVRGTWLGGFAQLLVQDMERRSIGSIFDNVSVISFNYDRTIRRFLPLALQSQFAISLTDAEELSKRLQIFHPYGTLGSLPWERPPQVAFGDLDNTLGRVADNIRTFTEQTDGDDNLRDMEAALCNADRIVFLGFGYLAQNMELLRRGVVATASSVLGTSYGLSDPDQELVTNQLNFFLGQPYRGLGMVELSRTKCANFIRENFRTLTS